jgi:uncharacterized membrane protein YsdA (DUF1294 family)
MGRWARIRLPCAHTLRIRALASHGAEMTHPAELPVAFGAAVAFFAILIGLVSLHVAPAFLLGLYSLSSVVLFALYGLDKSAAQRGRRRTPESNLHLLALAGGWPGALLGQYVFRHKTRKQPFRRIFWATVVCNCMLLALIVAESAAAPA